MFSKSPSTDQFPYSPFEVFQVNISPDRIIRPAGFYMATPGHPGKVTTKSTYERVRSPAKSSRFMARDYASAYKRSISYYNMVRGAPNLLTIVVGVLYKSKKHAGADMDILEEDGREYFVEGKDISYDDLFQYLYYGNGNGKNFDPLKTIRSKHGKVEEEMVRRYHRIERKNRDSVKAEMEAIAKELYDEVMDYFDGSEKPNLEPITIDRMRVAKQNANPDLYESGIGESLIESGQLRDAMNYQVFVEQTQDFKIQAEKEAKKLERMNAVQKERVRYEKAEIAKQKRLLKKAERKKDLEAIEKYKNMSEVVKEVALGSEVENKKTKERKSRKKHIEEVIVKMYDYGMLRGMRFKYRKGSKTYREIVEQNMEHASRLSAMWNEYKREHDAAMAEFKRTSDMKALYSFRKNLEMSGLMPDEKEIELMKAAHEILSSLGNTEM